MRLINTQAQGGLVIDGNVYQPNSDGIYDVPDRLVNEGLYKRGFVSAHALEDKLRRDRAVDTATQVETIPEPVVDELQKTDINKKTKDKF